MQSGHVEGLRPARLKVGLISAGRVGTALGVALERADHVVVAASAVSAASRRRAEDRLPDTPIRPPDEVAANAELLILAVPDAELAGLVSGLAVTGAVKPGTEPGLEATDYFGPERGATASGVHAMIVEVDPETPDGSD